MIARDEYLRKLQDRHLNGQVKVITGIRRCGKSYLLKTIFRQWLKRQGVVAEQIISVDLEKKSFLRYRNPLELAKLVEERVHGQKGQFYLFVDEIQLSEQVPNPWLPSGKPVTFYDALNDFREFGNLDVYVTGSNSKMLSSDILTEFRGRGDEIRVHPLSFKEYFAAVGGDVRNAFDDYLYFGGMPYVQSCPDDEAKSEYLRKLCEEVYLKDVVERKKVERPDVLAYALDLLCSSVGSLTNPTNVANGLNTRHRVDISVNTIRNYVDFLKDAFLVSEAKRYDIKGKAYFDYPFKYYLEDVGLRNARLGWRQQEKTHLMENVIYNDLIGRGCTVDVGVVQTRERDKNGHNVRKNREIDFVVNQRGQRVYIQSAWELGSEEKAESERKPFSQTGDSFRKILVRGDVGRRAWTDEYGNLNVSVYDFLLGPDILKG